MQRYVGLYSLASRVRDDLFANPLSFVRQRDRSVASATPFVYICRKQIGKNIYAKSRSGDYASQNTSSLPRCFGILPLNARVHLQRNIGGSCFSRSTAFFFQIVRCFRRRDLSPSRSNRCVEAICCSVSEPMFRNIVKN